MRLRVAGLTLLAGVLLLLPHAVRAADTPPPDKGLVVTPARNFITVVPGAQAGKKITLVNSTKKPLSVELSVEQFSVADYTYDYRFETAHDDWVKLGVTHIELQPGDSQEVAYIVSPSATAAPGGHYFTIFATATFGEGADKSQVRAASLLYTTVSGDTTIKSEVTKASVPRFAFGDINFTLEVKNTGNTHFFAYVTWSLNGAAGSGKTSETTHLLLPQTVRNIGGTIAAPLLPGVYTATYGYTTDTGQAIMRTARIIYIPVWSLFLVIGLVWIGIVLVRRFLRRHATGFLRPPYK